ncbi:hypothetical protein LK994_08455 [Ferruginibacter lapsinanis]|uniref:hypothetical protein n=1 Tax=Ferruginibacter lapsinanis TaxID=563172 RepID=UPI001E3EE363|nr:hypothetical protein [Ferruginibacter lapsinanis]UEG48666.1 hypothetical protein LK994_08455 [Ferruginibacter lapsinanis]
MRSKGLLLAAMSMALMGENMKGNKTVNKLKDVVDDNISEEPPLHQGCSRFYFNKDGLCSKGQHTVYFDVLNDSNANEEFEFWLNTQREQ